MSELVNQMPDLSMIDSVKDNLLIAIPLLIIVFGLIVTYLVLLTRAIIQMLRYKVSSVLLTFAFISLIPFPLILVLGIMILIIWHYHKKDLQLNR
jgi:hypothetical protein